MLPMSYPVVAKRNYDQVLKTPKRDRTPRMHRTESEGRPSRVSVPTTANVPNEGQLVTYGPSRQMRRGFMVDPRDQLIQKNTELMQELSDMRSRQTLWMERAEHLFAMQKTRFEQVAEEYTTSTQKRMLEEQVQFQLSMDNLKKDSSAQS